MDAVRGVSPLEAKKLVDSGYSYIDVRTELEFRSGHPSGAVNVPFVCSLAAGAPPNPDFVPVMQRCFASDHGLVVACAAGVRSRPAAEVLRAAGFRAVVELGAGFEGRVGPFGARAEPGWRASGLPVSVGDDEGSLAALLARS